MSGNLKRWFMPVGLALAWAGLAAGDPLKEAPAAEETFELPEADDVPTALPRNERLADWDQIKNDPKFPNGNIALEGFLDFQGTGDHPTIYLWRSSEALKHQMAFAHVLVGSKDAAKLINDHYGWGADNWEVLRGAFVEVHGFLERQAPGDEAINLGYFQKVFRIDVKNNGRVLLTLPAPEDKRNGSGSDGAEDTGKEKPKDPSLVHQRDFWVGVFLWDYQEVQP